MIPELPNGISHGFPKRVNKFFAHAQTFLDRAREMSRERSRGQPGTIESGRSSHGNGMLQVRTTASLASTPEA